MAGPEQPAHASAHVSRPWVCALVYDHELDATFPVEAHDQPVDAVCAPSRLVRFSGSGSGDNSSNSNSAGL